MPMKPKVPCRHPGCAALVPSGTKYCDVHKPLHPEEVRSAASRGYGRRGSLLGPLQLETSVQALPRPEDEARGPDSNLPLLSAAPEGAGVTSLQ